GVGWGTSSSFGPARSRSLFGGLSLMRLLVSGTTSTVSRLAWRWPLHLGHLLTPGDWGRGAYQKTGLPFGVDNGAFRGLDPVAFRRLLAWLSGHGEHCLWVCCPDVVGNARATLALFKEWQEEIAAIGVSLAFVGQDGAEAIEIPWKCFGCWF